ncbi:hypothetical protein [Kamptonema formosum]|uniref:hypothetical protein n=1 Tax=Kamptonema formosum TaxID=331992 RepID=UPI000346DAC0|nr:hypothetical protein [Oscillatoria sp. PCC 10802]
MSAFQISSSLQNQLFSQAVTWTLLTAKGKVAGPLDACRQQLTVEVWPNVVYVRLEKNVIRRECPWGISTFISYKDYLEHDIKEAFTKATSLKTDRISANYFKIQSETDTKKKSHQILDKHGITCDCMRYQCLDRRIWCEARHLHKLIQENEILQGQIPCHHAADVLKSLDFKNFADYFQEWPTIQAQIINEEDDEDDEDDSDYYW